MERGHGTTKGRVAAKKRDSSGTLLDLSTFFQEYQMFHGLHTNLTHPSKGGPSGTSGTGGARKIDSLSHAVAACDSVTIAGPKFIRAACACACSLLKCPYTLPMRTPPSLLPTQRAIVM